MFRKKKETNEPIDGLKFHENELYEIFFSLDFQLKILREQGINDFCFKDFLMTPLTNSTLTFEQSCISKSSFDKVFSYGMKFEFEDDKTLLLTAEYKLENNNNFNFYEEELWMNQGELGLMKNKHISASENLSCFEVYKHFIKCLIRHNDGEGIGYYFSVQEHKYYPYYIKHRSISDELVNETTVFADKYSNINGDNPNKLMALK